MRVLHIVPSLDPRHGGPSRCIPELCRALANAGLEIALWTFRAAGQAETVAEQEDWADLRRFPPFPGTHELPCPGFAGALRRAAPDFDLVHLHALWNPKITVAAAACRRARVPYLLTAHGMLQPVSLSVKGPLKRLYYRMFEKATLQGASAVHFLTEQEAEESARLLPPKMRRILAPNGIDPALGRGIQAGAFRRAYPQLQGRRLLLFLGRLHWSKGLNLQLEMLARLAATRPDVAWVLVGPDGGEWRQLSRQIRDRGLAERVLWTGPLPRRRCLEALADADLFLLTSRHEAHSMAMNEALAMGVPVLLTTGVRFYAVERSGAGWIVDPDPEKLAKAAAVLLNDAVLAGRMRRAGRKMAAEMAWPRVAATILQGYQAILGPKPRVSACEEISHA